MEVPTLEELSESIQDLRHYRDRLRKEVISISQKLRIPNQRINYSLENHAELNQLDKYLKKLIDQRKTLIHSKD